MQKFQRLNNMKHFKDATEKEISYLRTHPVEIVEKLDMIYFKVVINDSGFVVLNAKNREITDVDCIVNSVYDDIINYVHNVISYRTDEILDIFGPCEIGIFYHPVPKTNVITYTNVPYKFILCDFYTEDKEKNDDKKLADFLELIDRPVIKKFESGLPELPYDDNESIIRYLTDNKTWSGNSLDEIEGIVIQSPKHRFQVVVNNVTPAVEKESKKLYRDSVLTNLANVVFDQKIDVAGLKGNDYVEKACSLFMEYVIRTNILSKMYIEPGDLLPPTNGYMGDVVLTKLPSTVRLVCKGNSTYKNILRIILVTFNRRVNENKFREFPDHIKEKLILILKCLNK